MSVVLNIDSLTTQLTLLRSAVAFLGERDNAGWWTSAFFSKEAAPFLGPVFARTQVLAQCEGGTRAAAFVHDERIGIGRVYHLFRLPEDVEQRIHRALHEGAIEEEVRRLTASQEAASSYLRKLADVAPEADAGPVRIGRIEDVRREKAWAAVAAQYLWGFELGQECFPYFADG